MKCGFIGLGIMGKALATHLIPHIGKEIDELYVFNRTAEKGDYFVQRGAHFAEGPQALGKEADVVMTMLSRPEVVREISMGDGGFLKELRPGALWIDFSTVGPKFTCEMAQTCKENGVHYVDCPVSGSKRLAEEARLTLLLGASEQEWNYLYETHGFIFDSISRKVIPCGGVGKASALKMVVNMQLGIACASFAEGMQLGESMGFDREMLLDLFEDNPVVAPFLGPKKEKFLHGEFPAEFPLEWMQKDFDLVLETSHELGGFMPISSLVNELYALAKKQGHAREDFSAIREIYSNKGGS